MFTRCAVTESYDRWSEEEHRRMMLQDKAFIEAIEETEPDIAEDYFEDIYVMEY